MHETDVPIDRWMDGCMHEWKYRCIDKWMDGTRAVDENLISRGGARVGR